MKYIIAILILILIFGVYVITYIINSKTNKPDGCKELKCEGCNMDCNKRSDINGTIH